MFVVVVVAVGDRGAGVDVSLVEAISSFGSFCGVGEIVFVDNLFAFAASFAALLANNFSLLAATDSGVGAVTVTDGDGDDEVFESADVVAVFVLFAALCFSAINSLNDFTLISGAPVAAAGDEAVARVSVVEAAPARPPLPRVELRPRAADIFKRYYLIIEK